MNKELGFKLGFIIFLLAVLLGIVVTLGALVFSELVSIEENTKTRNDYYQEYLNEKETQR